MQRVPAACICMEFASRVESNVDAARSMKMYVVLCSVCTYLMPVEANLFADYMLCISM